MSFTLDAFQKKSIEWIDQDHSVLVSAPTGAGKTVIAEYAIQQALSVGKNVIYTAPIKALSNQKFRDFRAQYPDQVGILTGDVSINPDAPILIMTTEIYRNSLFEDSDRIAKTGWVIFDEVHYLDDFDRGTVWEEALLFTPNHIKILALSATVPNVAELCEWIQSIHQRPIAIVEENHRPVPLDFRFQCQGRILNELQQLKKHGYQNREIWRPRARERKRGMRMPRPKPNRMEPLLQDLIHGNQLPAIYFAFGRRRTEFLAFESMKFDFLKETSKKQKIIADFETLLEKYDLTHETSAQEMKPLLEHGIAFHHAGMLPTLKEVIEQLFTSRQIQLIFTTETFALGINMPARSVIFDELEKYYGHGFQPLTTRDFFQMAGRAGRRGLDKQGHVYIRINPRDIDYPTVQRIIKGKPESVRSQLNATYATLLNLYQTLGDKLSDVYPRTFHYFQSHRRKRRAGFEMIQRKLDMLRELKYIENDEVTHKGKFAACLFGYELYMAEMHEDLVFDNLTPIQLNVLISGLILEPRKGDQLPRLSNSHKKMLRTAEQYGHFIYRKERKFKVQPYTKLPHMNFAPTVEAWSNGSTFNELFKHTRADEGELVRHFRMIVQLLRELLHAQHASVRLKKTAHNAIELINRDVVDAEKQLRV